MVKNNGSLTANLVQVAERRIVKAELSWSNGVIRSVQEQGSEQDGLAYLIPGFVDAHVHIESSLLIPSEFARIAVRHGSIGCICDPHEIANVLGIPGIHFMLDNARKTPFHFLFGAPACVPSTAFESSGAEFDAAAIERLLGERGIGFLAEMMNVPSVLARDPPTMAKIAAARRNGRPVDGHAPGLRGAALREYAAAGITTDHECTTLEEALEKIACGMHIEIREGTAARNFDALHPLIRSHPDRVMFCSDDIQPDDLLAGHIDRLAARAIAEGHDVFDVLRCACINPARHYRLPVGQLREGDPMDAVELGDLTGFRVSRTWLGGIPAFQDGACSLERISATASNNFHASAIAPEDLAVVAAGDTMKIIEVTDGDLCSSLGHAHPKVVNGRAVADSERDILLLCVVNRYGEPPLPLRSCVDSGCGAAHWHRASPTTRTTSSRSAPMPQ
jgi:adenine deaminase